jgi:hypothetical protein
MLNLYSSVELNTQRKKGDVMNCRIINLFFFMRPVSTPSIELNSYYKLFRLQLY